MEELFEKLYNSYLVLLEDLQMGYPLTNKNMNEVWELMHLIHFVLFGHPSESEMLWIADKYENSKALLIDVSFDDEFNL